MTSASSNFIMLPPEEPIEERAVRFLQAVIEHHGHGEARPQQVKMVETVSRGIEDSEHVLIQAGTGVGKTFGHLVPLICSGKRGVVSTATNQLSEQIGVNDLPFLNQISISELGKPLNYTLLKGRANYVCLRKVAELQSLDDEAGGNADAPALALPGFDMVDERHERRKRRGEEAAAVIEWSNKRGIDGDRSNAPAVSEETWRTVSSTNAECPGKAACPFGEQCFAEIARDKARKAQIVVTNHALVGMDLSSGEGGILLGERDVAIFDEVHELDSYLSDAWGTTLTAKIVEDAARTARRAVPANAEQQRDLVEELAKYSERLAEELENVEEGRVKSWMPSVDNNLRGIYDIAGKLFLYCMGEAEDSGNPKSEQIRYKIAANTLRELEQSAGMLYIESDDVVKWISLSDKEIATLHAAPLRIGPRLMSTLHNANMTMIATSATITVGGEFDIPVRNLALDEPIVTTTFAGEVTEPATRFHALDVGTPFNYPQQGIMYVPMPDEFPAPIGTDRFEHTEAVLEFLVKAVKAAGGRTLALSTTTAGARRMADRLRDEVSTPVLTQWDATPGVIAQEWIDDEKATLCATMGMWHGLNPMGPTCSLVVMDKIPFAPMNDPLMTARQEDVNERGGSGFMDVYVAAANVMLAQGAGRLIRHTADRGVVAILDTRLRSKRYGAAMLRSLPPMWRTGNQADVFASLKRLTSS